MRYNVDLSTMELLLKSLGKPRADISANKDAFSSEISLQDSTNKEQKVNIYGFNADQLHNTPLALFEDLIKQNSSHNQYTLFLSLNNTPQKFVEINKRDPMYKNNDDIVVLEHLYKILTPLKEGSEGIITYANALGAHVDHYTQTTDKDGDTGIDNPEQRIVKFTVDWKGKPYENSRLSYKPDSLEVLRHPDNFSLPCIIAPKNSTSNPDIHQYYKSR